MLSRRDNRGVVRIEDNADDWMRRGNTGAPSETASLNVLAVLWRGRYLVVLTTVLALGAAAIYLARATPIYSSSSQIYMEKSAPRLIGEDYEVSSRGSSLVTQVEILKSTAILNNALKLPSVQAASVLRGSSNPVGELRSMLNVTGASESGVITLDVESTDADEAAVLANGVVEAYVNYIASQQKSDAAEVLKMLQAEKSKREAEYRKLTQSILDFKRKNGVLSLSTDKGSVVLDRLSELSTVLTQAELDAQNARIAMKRLEEVKDDPFRLQQFMALDIAGIGGVSNEYNSLASEYEKNGRGLSRLEKLFGERNPNVIAMRAELSDVEQNLARLRQMNVNFYRGAIVEKLATAVLRQDELRTQYEQQRTQAFDLNVRTAELSQMETDARRTERLLDLLDNRIKEVDVNGRSSTMSVTILEPAKPNLEPVRPNPTTFYRMALVMGLLAGAGLSFVRELMDQRIRSIDEIAGLLELPVLGIVPHIPGNMPVEESGRLVELKPTSDVAEAFRTVRTAICFGGSEASVQVLLVASPSPGDGKTTVASNLACAMAQAGRRTLLIDADCRKPRQHHIFAKKDGLASGLTSVLRSGLNPDQAIRPSGFEHLDLLLCGPLPTNPAEMLNGQAFLDLLKTLRQQYDQIIIDSPPVVPVTDARILSAAADATVLVLRAEKSTRRVSRHACEALHSVGGRPIGVVVNDVPRRRASYGYYGAYGYYYGANKYGDDDTESALAKKNGNGHAMPSREAPLLTAIKDKDTE